MWRTSRQILDKNGWHLAAILNTHFNADHIGGNRYLQGQTGCKVYSGGIEAAFTKYPVLEPSFLSGGYPCKDLRHKFLMAQESDVVDFSDESFPKEIEVIPLPGHFFDMAGFRMPDGVVFLADCISSRETLDKYAIRLNFRTVCCCGRGCSFMTRKQSGKYRQSTENLKSYMQRQWSLVGGMAGTFREMG